MYGLFKARAEAAGAEVHRVATRREAIDLVLDVLRADGVAEGAGSYAVCAGCPFLDGLDREELARSVPGLRFEVTRELAAEARVGISQLDRAVADTGTLAQAAADVEQRLVSTLVGVHVALVASDRIVPGLAELLAVLSPAQEPYVALITGPSRTADIERVLTIGVHGPERLVIVLVDELGGSR